MSSLKSVKSLTRIDGDLSRACINGNIKIAKTILQYNNQINING